MSVHKSLRLRNKLERRRNVLTREERIARLRQEERWQEGRSIYGLPKVKVIIKAPRKRAKEEKPAAVLAEGEAAVAAAAEGAAAKPADEKPARKLPGSREPGGAKEKGRKERDKK